MPVVSLAVLYGVSLLVLTLQLLFIDGLSFVLQDTLNVT